MFMLYFSYSCLQLYNIFFKHIQLLSYIHFCMNTLYLFICILILSYGDGNLLLFFSVYILYCLDLLGMGVIFCYLYNLKGIQNVLETLVWKIHYRKSWSFWCPCVDTVELYLLQHILKPEKNIGQDRFLEYINGCINT